MTHLLPSVWRWSYHYLFYQLRSVTAAIQNTQSSACMSNALTHCDTAATWLFGVGFFCLFVLGFFVPLENFSLRWRHHYCRWRAANVLCLASIAFEQWEFLERATLTVTRSIRLYWSYPRTHDTQTNCQAFGRGAVTTCFYDLGLSRLGFEHPTFRLQSERSRPLRHRRGLIVSVFSDCCYVSGVLAKQVIGRRISNCIYSHNYCVRI